MGNIFFVDAFLGGAFLTYGTDVLKFSNMNQEQRSDPMVEVFPRVTKCTFHKFGASGTIQKLDALCVLALNILNEKIYIFLWFWFIILAVLSGIALLYGMAVVLLPSTRETILRKRFKFGSSASVTALIREIQVNRRIGPRTKERIANPSKGSFRSPFSFVRNFRSQVGDFLLLHLLGQNMNMVMFNEVLSELCQNMPLGSVSGASPASVPSAPSTLEMSPIYPEIEKYAKDTEI